MRRSCLKDSRPDASRRSCVLSPRRTEVEEVYHHLLDIASSREYSKVLSEMSSVSCRRRSWKKAGGTSEEVTLLLPASHNMPPKRHLYTAASLLRHSSSCESCIERVGRLLAPISHIRGHSFSSDASFQRISVWDGCEGSLLRIRGSPLLLPVRF